MSYLFLSATAWFFSVAKTAKCKVNKPQGLNLSPASNRVGTLASLPVANDKVALVSGQDAIGDLAVGTCIRVNC